MPCGVFLCLGHAGFQICFRCDGGALPVARFVAFQSGGGAPINCLMKRMRASLSALLLAFVLVFTGQSMALARFMETPSGEMVLCTGTGPITVLTDDQGDPVGPAHICPDCALGFFAAVDDAPDMPLRPTGVSRLVHADIAITAPSSRAPRATARGPPQGV